MTDRPKKLNPPAVLVIWASRELTLAEKVVWYRDWSLDHKGPDGCYAGPAGLSAGLGGSLTPGTVSTLRQRLKRLGLHLAIDRGPGANVGWVSIVPPGCEAHASRDAAAIALRLDAHIRAHDRGLAEVPDDGMENLGGVESGFSGGRNRDSSQRAAAFVGGRGVTSRSSMRKAQLSSVVSSTEKRVGARAPEEKREDQRPASVIRDEGLALIRLQQGKTLTPVERQLVEGWLERNPGKATASDLRRRLSA